MTRIKKTTDIELDRFHPRDAARLLAFNITKQRIADRANALQFSLPWEDDKAYSTWHRALDGQEVWVEIVQGLDRLMDEQTRDPRKYLPGPPGDDLFQWMQEIAGATWWVKTLGLNMKANTLTAWMTRGGAKQDMLDDLRAKVVAWWARVDAACTQADMVRIVAEIERAEGPDWDGVSRPHAKCWDSYFYTYVHEDGHTVDEAREHWAQMCDLSANHHLRLIDLSNPHLAERIQWSEEVTAYRPGLDRFRADFDERWSEGLPRAIPRKCPEGLDLTPYEEVKRWGDRRDEEGEKDVNVPLYRLFYKQRVTPYWDEQERRRSSDVEIIAVSEDGANWRTPNAVEKKGWDYQYLEKARYRNDHGTEPLNSYFREIEEAEHAVKRARADLENRWARAKHSEEALEAKLRAAESALSAAREDY